MVGVNGQKFRIGVTGKTFGLDRCDGGWDIKNFGGFCQRDNVVLQGLTIHGLHAEGHLRLLVNKNKLAVVRSEKFKFARHLFFPLFYG